MGRVSSTVYINTNDFIGALLRFEESNARWKTHWFETCFTIANNNTEYLEKYLFNEKECTIVKMKYVCKYMDKAPSHTYLIFLLDEYENEIFLKVGKANEIKKRFEGILKEKYCKTNCITDVCEIQIWEMPNEDLAEAFESMIKNYIKDNKNVGFFRNDRFTPFMPTKEDFKVFAEMRNNILKMSGYENYIALV